MHRNREACLFPAAEAVFLRAMNWETAPVPPALGAGEVHVWRVHLGIAGACGDPPDEAALAAEERERASSYPAGEPRRRFLTSRARLRSLLSGYLGAAPREVRLAYGEQGKPSLREPAADLTFNLSHSGDLLLLAFGRGRELGIDVERTGRDVAWERVARRFFERRELEALRSLPAAERRAAFFRCWTRKEAFVKATGRGVTQGLRSFAVSLDPAAAALTWIQGGDPADWGMADVDAGPGHAAAVCAAGRGWSLRCFEPAPAS